MDIVNGLFELIGGILMMYNVKELYIAKKVVGVYLPASLYFAIWGIWNLFYYPALNQPWSFAGGIVLAIASITWLVMAVYYRVQEEVPLF